jgi:hypothetical protein
MKQSGLQIWHRCGTCGTIFSDLEELRSHLEQHTGSKRRTSPVDEQDRANSAAISPRDHKSDIKVRKITDVAG